MTDTFFSREKVSASVPPASKGLCPFETCAPFKKGSILNFLSREFGIDTFLKGSWVSRGQSPRSLIAMSEISYTQVRSEKGEFPKQSEGLFGKEGKPCKRGLPLTHFRFTKTPPENELPVILFSSESQAGFIFLIMFWVLLRKTF